MKYKEGTASYCFNEGDKLRLSGQFDDAIKCYQKVLNFNSMDAARAYNRIGIVYADDKQDYDRAIKYYKSAIDLDPKFTEAHFNMGIDYANGKQDYEMAIKCFKKSQEDILNILVSLGEENKKPILQLLKPLLGKDDFFNKIIQNVKEEDNLDKYKDVYLLSVLIISQLYVNDEKLVAYYTQKDIAEKLLFEESKFRLNSINYSNDPNEGQTLLDYLFNATKTKKFNPNNEYAAFAGCFTFNPDSLNQFRLYGKEENKECTGLSLVFNNYFFRGDAKLGTQVDKNEEDCTLYRCIYIDPETNFVVSVGHKEEYLFKKEKANKETITKYKKYISDVLERVRANLKDLKKMVKDLDPEIIGQLLINLRYLTKHVAFKEEQECRIVSILSLNKENKKIQIDEYKQMYIDYWIVKGCVNKIYFGTKTVGMKLFQDILKHKDLEIPCERSKNPFH